MNTPAQVVLRSGTFGEITFTGQGLALTQVDISPTLGVTFSVAQLTAGTLSNISVRFNHTLDQLTSALALANDAAKPAIQQQINEVNEQTLAQLLAEAAGQTPAVSHLVPNSTVVVPNISAAELGTAAIQGLQTGSEQAMVAFLNQFQVAFTTTGVVTSLTEAFDIGGFDQADLLMGSPGNNNLSGNGGDDTLNGGGGGLDKYLGGPGNDLYILGAGTDTVSDSLFNPLAPPAQNEIDTVSYQNAPTGVEVRLAQQATNPGTGWALGDTFIGVEGIIGSNFNDTIFGGSGQLGDVLPVILNGLAGNDGLQGGNNSDTLQGGPGDDTLVGGLNQDTLGNPGPGDLAVYTSAPQQVHFFAEPTGLQIVTPREGIDLLVGMERISLAGQVFSNPGQITLSAANRMFGDDMAVSDNGGEGVDLMFGRGGDDALGGLGANDIVDGGDGNDSLDGGNGDDVVSGGTGEDTLVGGFGNDSLFGDEEADRVHAGNENDVVEGGAGNDTLHGDNEEDMLDGGAGNDTLTGGRGEDTVLGGADNDELWGWLGHDSLNGGEGDDLLIGEEDSDTLDGWSGNDSLFGGQGFDSLSGGDGDDLLSGDTENDTLLGGDGNDTLWGGHDDDLLFGEVGNDMLWGWLGNDILEGGVGEDTLHGEEGNDVVSGGEDNDSLSGGSGNDTLWGFTGDDTLEGASGDDELRGEAGSDVFIFADGDGDDTIFGFDAMDDAEDIDLSAVSTISSFADLDPTRMFQDGPDVLIDTGAGTTIRLEGVTLGDLDANDFVF